MTGSSNTGYRWASEQMVVHNFAAFSSLGVLNTKLASAYHHESNGHAECAVREVKKLLAKTPSYDAFRQMLRSYRNCPRYDGLSPAQWYVSRRQRTDAVAFPATYNHIPDAMIAKHKAKRRNKMGKLHTHTDQTSRQKSTGCSSIQSNLA